MCAHNTTWRRRRQRLSEVVYIRLLRMRSGPHSDPRPDSSYLRGSSARERNAHAHLVRRRRRRRLVADTGLPTHVFPYRRTHTRFQTHTQRTRSRTRLHQHRRPSAVMCRALRCQHPQMAPQQKNNNYANRLDSLKQVLKRFFYSSETITQY